MRKFKVVKKWPGGPEVGLIGELGLENVSFTEVSNYKRWHTLEELEGFVEEVKEPVKGWMCGPCGLYEAEEGYGLVKHMAFRTKESAEKFAKALKESHGHKMATEQTFVEMSAICRALNDRVTD